MQRNVSFASRRVKREASKLLAEAAEDSLYRLCTVLVISVWTDENNPGSLLHWAQTDEMCPYMSDCSFFSLLSPPTARSASGKFSDLIVLFIPAIEYQ